MFNRLSIIAFLSLFPILSTAAGQHIVNGSFEFGINSDWQHSFTSGNAQFSLDAHSPAMGGTSQLKINYSVGSSDPFAISSSTTVMVENEEIYLLRFAARESKEFVFDTANSQFEAYPDFAKMIVRVAGNNGFSTEV